jgi:hypothetical protein
MVYVGEASGSSEIVAQDRNGRVSEIPAGAGIYRILDVSPDDRTVAGRPQRSLRTGRCLARPTTERMLIAMS